MSDTFSREQLRDRILEKMRVTGEGQPPSPEQQELVEKTLTPGFAEMRRRRVVVMDPNGPFPIEYQEHFADWFIFSNAEQFGRAPDPAKRQFAENNIRSIDADGPTFEPVEVDPIMRGGAVVDGRDYKY